MIYLILLYFQIYIGQSLIYRQGLACFYAWPLLLFNTFYVCL